MTPPINVEAKRYPFDEHHLLDEFKPLETANIEGMTSLVASMLKILKSIDNGLIPNAKDYSAQSLESYLISLVEGQREKIVGIKDGSWMVAPDAYGMPADARVDFVFRPTYVATATLARVYLDHSYLVAQISGYKRALVTGLRFCTYRRLRGHGYEADEGAIDALTILSLGKVPSLLMKHPELCPKLREIIRNVAEDMETRLKEGEAFGAWNTDYSAGFHFALNILRDNNPGFIS